MQDSNIVIQPGIPSCNWLAPHRLLDISLAFHISLLLVAFVCEHSHKVFSLSIQWKRNIMLSYAYAW